MSREPAVIISAIVGLLIALASQYIESVQVLDAVRTILEWGVPLLVALIGGWLIRARVTPVKK